MKTPSVFQQSMATCLALLLVSCSATRPATVEPDNPKALGRYALIIEESLEGEVTHQWKPLEHVALTDSQQRMRAQSSPQGIVHVSTDRREYCAGRYDQCMADCLASSKPISVGHLIYPTYRGPWNIHKGRWCQESCLELKIMCEKGRGEWAVDYVTEFDTSNSAVDWLKRHRTEVPVGTVIIIAGVAFVAVAAAGAVLLLLPLLALAEAPSAPPLAPLVMKSSP
jgi:hypothetical protein